jgi:hypothetical protein
MVSGDGNKIILYSFYHHRMLTYNEILYALICKECRGKTGYCFIKYYLIRYN